jgi:hypothetical protein
MHVESVALENKFSDAYGVAVCTSKTTCHSIMFGGWHIYLSYFPRSSLLNHTKHLNCFKKPEAHLAMIVESGTHEYLAVHS